jgi:predicted small metal-binding protein
MKKFTCASLGNNCNAAFIAPTEDRLVELVSLHLREVHGMTAISQDYVAQIKKLFSSRATADAAKVVDRIFEKYNCNGEPECSWRYIAEAEMILTGSPTVHAQELKIA